VDVRVRQLGFAWEKPKRQRTPKLFMITSRILGTCSGATAPHTESSLRKNPARSVFLLRPLFVEKHTGPVVVVNRMQSGVFFVSASPHSWHFKIHLRLGDTLLPRGNVSKNARLSFKKEKPHTNFDWHFSWQMAQQLVIPQNLHTNLQLVKAEKKKTTVKNTDGFGQLFQFCHHFWPFAHIDIDTKFHRHPNLKVLLSCFD